jgi:hypothetical protein
MVQKRGDGWRSKFAVNFWPIFRISFEDPTWRHSSDLIVSWSCYGTSEDLAGSSVNIVNDQNKSASLDAKFMSKVLAEFMERILTAPYCAGHVILLRHRTPSAII